MHRNRYDDQLGDLAHWMQKRMVDRKKKVFLGKALRVLISIWNSRNPETLEDSLALRS